MRQSSPSTLQDLSWRLQAFALDVVTLLVRALPPDAASGLGGAITRAFGPLTGADRTARRNLTLAFPEMGKAERERILRAQWESFGRYIIELLFMDKLTPASGRVEVVGAERLAQIAAGDRPCVFISGHFSNMEIMPSAILAAGIDCVITGRALNNPYVNERVIEGRRRYGVNIFAPKGSDGSRELLKALAEGRSVALMNDQKFNQGVAAPFFGHLAHTASGPTKMALRSGAILQPMSVQRTQGARFRVMIHDPIELQHTGDRNADVEAGVRQINAFIEARVRDRPEEWWWVHKRWANEVYAQLAADEANAAS